MIKQIGATALAATLLTGMGAATAQANSRHYVSEKWGCVSVTYKHGKPNYLTGWRSRTGGGVFTVSSLKLVKFGDGRWADKKNSGAIIKPGKRKAKMSWSNGEAYQPIPRSTFRQTKRVCVVPQ